MSALDELWRLYHFRSSGKDFGEAIDDYRAEVRAETLREAADTIDDELRERVKERIGGIGWEIRSVSTAQHAAELLRRMAEGEAR
jgi:hypothetical protein